MEEEAIKDYSEIFKALGHPTRLAIVLGLSEQKCNVNHMVNMLKISQSTVSQHLAILRRLGILDYKKTGLEVCYGIKNPIINELIKVIQNSVK